MNFLSQLFLLLATSLCFSIAQYFDPNIDDKTYLDTLQTRLQMEVNVTKMELVIQAKITEMVAKKFVTAQLKENLFIALRVIAEKELKELNKKKDGVFLQPQVDVPALEVLRRQDDSDNDEKENNNKNTNNNNGIYPQVSNLIQAIFGKGKDNSTNYVEPLASFESSPMDSQILGLVSAVSAQQQLMLDVPLSPGAASLPSNSSTPTQQQNFPPQENQLFIAPNNLPQKLPSMDETLETFLSQFHATQLQGGVVNNGGSDEELNGNIKSRPYNYNPSGSKGVASSTATLRPALAQQLNTQGQNAQPPFNQFGPPAQFSPLQNQQGGAGGGGRPPPTQQQQKQQQQGPFEVQSTTTVATDEDVDEDEDEDAEVEGGDGRRRQHRQFNLVNLLSTVFRTTKRPEPITPAPVAQKVTITTDQNGQAVVVQTAADVAVGPQPAAAATMMPEAFNIQTFAQTVGKNMADIIRIMPDIFRGAREGVQLIQSISSVFGGLGDVAGGIL